MTENDASEININVFCISYILVSPNLIYNSMHHWSDSICERVVITDKSDSTMIDSFYFYDVFI